MMTVVQLALVLVIASLLSCASASTKRSLPSNRQLLVGYWGQNAAGPTFGRLNYERDLRHFCNNYDFDIYVIAFVHRLFDVRNKGPDPKLPGMNFAHHCSYVPDANYPGIYECATIGGGIRDCQKMGKKVIISLGGDTCDGTLGSAANARALAYNIWNMFLGGQDLPGKRPFLSAVLDGVDLDIEVGSYKYYPDFVREIRQLMRTDSSRQYLITAAPQCPFPDKWMGPQTPGSALEEVGSEFDYLFIQFYNNYCYPGSSYFVSVMDTWLNWANGITNGPKIILGLPAGTGAAGKPHYYFTPEKLAEKYKLIRDKPGVSGIMLWDCSWAQNNKPNGNHYSEHAFKLVSGGTVKPPPVHPTTNAPPQPPATTKAPLATDKVTTTTKAPVTTSQPSGPVSCSSLGDGTHPDPNDCSKFVMCAGGVAYPNSCPAGLLYNKKTKNCDWPSNVTC
ncbi:acidic endochitinase [Nematostella vectensis]|uniref:acidic endochitinase n=1 Tax=Nematostella vectensis TaxID=45351 RepID=UPI00207768B4|nr:acidic endochitinase [Nematostella vectensis]